VVARQGGQQQACELVADRLAQADDGGRSTVLDAVQAGAVLEDQSEPATGFRGGGGHAPVIGEGLAAGDPSPE